MKEYSGSSTAASSHHAPAGGERPMLRELSRLLRDQGECLAESGIRLIANQRRCGRDK